MNKEVLQLLGSSFLNREERKTLRDTKSSV
jgi:hypothetical protein